MEGAAVKEIVGLVGPKVVEINGKSFAQERLVEMKSDSAPSPETIKIHTLSGLVDYIKSNLDHSEGYVVHIIEHDQVYLLGELEKEFGRRKLYCRAIFEEEGFRFGSWMDQERMVIDLQALFSPTEERENVIKQVANVVDESRIEQTDDGVSQGVTVKTGVGRRENETLKNPATLAPYRTFPEIDQVESPFILRMRKTDTGVGFALFESGGARWKLDTIHRIRDYLKGQLKEIENLAIIA